VDECKPLLVGLLERVEIELVSDRNNLDGMGLHSFTFQVNLSRFGHTFPCPRV
jgi:hypothetical protein